MEKPIYHAVGLLGLQGSGKSTVSEHFRREGYTSVTMSSVLGENKAELISRGFDPKKMKKGILCPDEIVIDLFRKTIEGVHSNIILDGCLRTPVQAEGLIRIFRELDFDSIFFHLDCPIDVCVERIRSRVPIREDDRDPSVVELRLNTTLRYMDDVINYIVDGETLPLFTINTNQNPEYVISQVKGRVRQVFSPSPLLVRMGR